MNNSADYSALLNTHPDLFPEGFDLWIGQFGGLREQISPVLYTSLMWVRWCSPLECTDAQRCIAGADLALFFFSIDDASGRGRLRLYTDVQELLDGRNPRPDSDFFRGAEDILNRMREFGLPLDRYIESRKELLAQYRTRLALGNGETISFTDYLNVRKVTIYIDQWLDMWEVLGDFMLDEGELERVSKLKDALVLWHVLKNDLVSVERDRKAGIPNLVSLRAAELGIDSNEASRRLEHQASSAQGAFLEETRNLQRVGLSPKLKKYAALLTNCYDGGVRNYCHVNPERYRA